MSEETRRPRLAHVHLEALRGALHGADAHDGEAWISELEHALWSYRDPDAARAAAHADPGRGEAERALAVVVARARALSDAIDAVPAEAVEWLGARGGLDIDAWAALQRAALRVEAASQPGVAAPTAPVRAGDDHGAVTYVASLAVLWERVTDAGIPQDRTATSEWSRFVEVACDVAGIESAQAHRIRLRVYDTLALSESAALLDSIPDP